MEGIKAPVQLPGVLRAGGNELLQGLEQLLPGGLRQCQDLRLVLLSGGEDQGQKEYRGPLLGAGEKVFSRPSVSLAEPDRQVEKGVLGISLWIIGTPFFSWGTFRCPVPGHGLSLHIRTIAVCWGYSVPSQAVVWEWTRVSPPSLSNSYRLVVVTPLPSLIRSTT